MARFSIENAVLYNIVSRPRPAPTAIVLVLGSERGEGGTAGRKRATGLHKRTAAKKNSAPPTRARKKKTAGGIPAHAPPVLLLAIQRVAEALALQVIGVHTVRAVARIGFNQENARCGELAPVRLLHELLPQHGLLAGKAHRAVRLVVAVVAHHDRPLEANVHAPRELPAPVCAHGATQPLHADAPIRCHALHNARAAGRHLRVFTAPRHLVQALQRGRWCRAVLGGGARFRWRGPALGAAAPATHAKGEVQARTRLSSAALCKRVREGRKVRLQWHSAE